MDERKAFEDAIRTDPYDSVTRLVFADWLEERGRDDEAAEQRRCSTVEWIAADRLLCSFAEQAGQTCLNYEPPYEELRWRPLTRDDLIQAGHDWLKSGGEDWFTQVGQEELRNMMYGATLEEYWRCWQIVTGLTTVGSVPLDSPFSCTC